MTSSRRPPSFIPAIPWSQPGMTCPAPSGNSSGCPLFQEASNSPPVDHALPTYCMETVSPALAVLPLPLTMSSVTSSAGGEPAGLSTAGFSERSLEIVAGSISPGASAVASAVGSGVAAVSCSSSSPHAAAKRARSRQASRIGRRVMAGQDRKRESQVPAAGGR